jgi:hypothetical protein
MAAIAALHVEEQTTSSGPHPLATEFEAHAALPRLACTEAGTPSRISSSRSGIVGKPPNAARFQRWNSYSGISHNHAATSTSNTTGPASSGRNAGCHDRLVTPANASSGATSIDQRCRLRCSSHCR